MSTYDTDTVPTSIRGPAQVQRACSATGYTGAMFSPQSTIAGIEDARLERRSGVRPVDNQPQPTPGVCCAQRLHHDHRGSSRRQLPMIMKCAKGARCRFARRDRMSCSRAKTLRCSARGLRFLTRFGSDRRRVARLVHPVAPGSASEDVAKRQCTARHGTKCPNSCQLRQFAAGVPRKTAFPVSCNRAKPSSAPES